MADDEKQINIRVSSDTKARWIAVVDDNAYPEYRTLSLLVRTAVEHEIANNHSETSNSFTSAGFSENDVEQLGELLDKSQATINRLDSMDDDLQIIRRAVTTDREIVDLMGDIYASLPVGDETIIYSYEQQQGQQNVIHPDKRIPSGKPGDLAERFDTTEEQVNRAINQLQEDMPGVVCKMKDHYYRTK